MLEKYYLEKIKSMPSTEHEVTVEKNGTKDQKIKHGLTTLKKKVVSS